MDAGCFLEPNKGFTTHTLAERSDAHCCVSQTGGDGLHQDGQRLRLAVGSQQGAAFASFSRCTDILSGAAAEQARLAVHSFLRSEEDLRF